MKQNKLYTVNKWNRPAFMPHEYGIGGTVDVRYDDNGLPKWNESQVITWNPFESTGNWTIKPLTGISDAIVKGSEQQFQHTINTGLTPDTTHFVPATTDKNNPFEFYLDDHSRYFSHPGLFGKYSNVDNWQAKPADDGNHNWFGISKENNPFSKQNIGGTMQGIAGAALNTEAGDKLLDVADPMHHIAGGRERAVGNTLDTAGKGLFKAGAQTGNGWLMLAGAGAKVLGGLTNAAFGTKWNKENIKNVENNITGMQQSANDLANATSQEGLVTAWGNTNTGYDFGTGYIGKNGWFNKKATRKANQLRNQQNTARGMVMHSLGDAANRVDEISDNNIMANFAAFGGPINTADNMGAIDYNFMSDYLNNKRLQASNKNTAFINTFPSTFALGGDLQTHGADFSSGLVHVDNGGTHSENPNGGVQMGMAPDGQPNLVEEGEVIWNDYVFSNRIKVNTETLKMFHMNKNSDMTYADLAKKLEEEAKERPNDPISEAALKKNMEKLEEAQEKQKQKEEAENARKAFESLSPEEQQALIQQIANRQQASEQPTDEQLAEQQSVEPQEESQQEPQVKGQSEEQQVSPEEAQAMQQQAAQQEQPVMAAYGGDLHVFKDGGSFRDRVLAAMGFSTVSDFNKWAKNNSYNPDNIDWDAIEKDHSKLDYGMVAKKSLALKNNYDFGVFKPNVNGYNLDAFNKTLNNYTYSRNNVGNTKGNYKVDKAFNLGNYKTIEDLENSEGYRKYTNALVDVANAAKGLKFKLNNGILEGGNLTPEKMQLLNTLYTTANNTKTATKGLPVPMFVNNGDGTYSIANNAQEMLVGSDGKSGLRYDHKGGIFHLTPEAVALNNKMVNRVINSDGTVEDIIGDVPKEWGNAVSTYSWYDPTTNYTYSYYERPKETKGKGNLQKIPYADDRLRYAGLMAPIVELGMQASGYGKPDFGDFNASMNYARNASGFADYKPIGNYIAYTPADVWAEVNKMDAISRAADRTIMNSSLPTATKYGLLMNNAYNNQLAVGDAHRKGLEYDDSKKVQTAGFNQKTDLTNAEAYNRAALTNAEMSNRNAQFNSQLASSIAAQKLGALGDWYSGIYGNVNNLFKGIGNIGKENAQHNMIAGVANLGALGVLPSEDNGDELYALSTGRDPKYKTKSTISAKGGKINKRRKGLTF